MQIIRDSISKFWYEHFCHNRSPREDKKDSECRKKKQKKEPLWALSYFYDFKIESDYFWILSYEYPQNSFPYLTSSFMRRAPTY